MKLRIFKIAATVENNPAIDNGQPFHLTLVVLLPIIEPGCRGEFAALSAGEYRTDQRDIDRPLGAECDIGAFEGELDPEITFFVIPLPNGKSVIFGL